MVKLGQSRRHCAGNSQEQEAWAYLGCQSTLAGSEFIGV